MDQHHRGQSQHPEQGQGQEDELRSIARPSSVSAIENREASAAASPTWPSSTAPVAAIVVVLLALGLGTATIPAHPPGFWPPASEPALVAAGPQHNGTSQLVSAHGAPSSTASTTSTRASTARVRCGSAIS